MHRVVEASPGELWRVDRFIARRTQAVWLIAIIATIFCLWRMAVFVPQPLDSSTTLRPVLYALFDRFIRYYGGPERAFSAWYTICSVALLIPPALAVLNYLPNRRIPGWLRSRTLLFLSIAVCLLACRYPALLEPELNPDEGQFLASADKLFYDADFFRAADCGTSGPVNIYPLMLPSILGITPDFASSRLIALAALFLSIWLLYRTIALVAPDEIARLAILPAVGMFAVFKNVGLVEYSSEDVPVLLSCIALYGAVRVLRNPVAYEFPLWLIGMASSAAFLAKLQAMPILAGLAAVSLLCVYGTRSAGKIWRPALFFAAGVAPLLLVHTLLCLATGVWHDFWIRYIVTNLYYADVESRFVTNLAPFLTYLTYYDEVRVLLFTSLGLTAAYLFQKTRREPAQVSAAFLQSAAVSAAAIGAAILLSVSNVPAFASYLTLIAIASTAIYLLQRWREAPLGRDPVRWFGLLTVVYILVSVLAVYEAHRPFPHYLLFLFIPFCAGGAWMLMRGSESLIGVMVMLVVVAQAYLWGTQDDHVFRNAVRTIRPADSDFIQSMTMPRGQIVVWGWTVAPYLGSGLVPTTRDTNMVNFFRWPAIGDYYRARFLEDMRKAPPQMFIDAVGPASFAMTNPADFGFARFPEIEAFVRANYVQVADRYNERYYLRRDLAQRK
jgi:hypothetical protein